ncbi:MAG: hypothetical protein AAF441_03590 [Pseudomonadota bacterium]
MDRIISCLLLVLLLLPPASSQSQAHEDEPFLPRIEEVEQRDFHSKTFANEDGTQTIQFGAQPVHYRTEEGTFDEIDTTLEADGDGWISMRNTIPLRLPRTLGGGSAVAAGPGLAIGWAPGALKIRTHSGELIEAAEAQLSDGEAVVGRPDAVLYRDVYPGIDLTISVAPGEIILAARLKDYSFEVPSDRVSSMVIEATVEAPSHLLTSTEIVGAEREHLGGVPLHFGGAEDEYVIFVGTETGTAGAEPRDGAPPAEGGRTASGRFVTGKPYDAHRFSQTGRVLHTLDFGPLEPAAFGSGAPTAGFAQLPVLSFNARRWLRHRTSVVPQLGGSSVHDFAGRNSALTCDPGEGGINRSAPACRACAPQDFSCLGRTVFGTTSAMTSQLRSGFPLQVLGGSRFPRGLVGHQTYYSNAVFNGLRSLASKFSRFRFSGLKLGYFPASQSDWKAIGPLAPDPSLMQPDADGVMIVRRGTVPVAGLVNQASAVYNGTTIRRADGTREIVYSWHGPSQRKDGWVYTPLNDLALQDFNQAIRDGDDNFRMTFLMRASSFRFFAMNRLRLEVTVQRPFDAAVTLTPEVLDSNGKPDPNAAADLFLGESLDIRLQTTDWKVARSARLEVENEADLLCGYGISIRFWDETGKSFVGLPKMGRFIENRRWQVVNRLRMRVSRNHLPGHGCADPAAVRKRNPGWGDRPRIWLSAYFMDVRLADRVGVEIPVILRDPGVVLEWSNDPPTQVAGDRTRGNVRLTTVKIRTGTLKGASQVNMIVAVRGQNKNYLTSPSKRLFSWYETGTTAIPGVLVPNKVLQLHAHPRNLAALEGGPFTIEIYPCLPTLGRNQFCPGNLDRTYSLRLTGP